MSMPESNGRELSFGEAIKEALAEELDNATYYIERNANAKILFHALTIKIYHIVKNNIVLSV